MDSALLDGQAGTFASIACADEAIPDLVRQVAESAQPQRNGVERRSHPRIPYPRLITLEPVDDSLTPVDDKIVVVGKNLALGGLDFFHCRPIPQRKVIANLECGLERTARLVLVLNWCRFLTPGWYDSGGRFTKILTSTDPAAQNNL